MVDDKSKTQKFISVKCVHFNLKCVKCEMYTFHLKHAVPTESARILSKMYAFHFEIHQTLNSVSILGVGG